MEEKLNNTCGECKHYIAMSRCILHSQFVHDDDCCGGYAPKPQPITNGDVIRQMSNEELAEIKDKLSCEVCAYANTGCYAPAGRPSDCKSGILAWLNAPAESEGENE